ncbi:MAG: hypothetical protein OXO49_01690 [Gammaproteobacteria bacterium]|nr:hypothetical protein [Gammaproteobacteria bacterium]MDE0252534.1 hypothetical protein [Gammaproteobacteria bacterium]MDE0402982.1 hypothetical protein [Gammaproteobacteria bacterium]
MNRTIKHLIILLIGIFLTLYAALTWWAEEESETTEDESDSEVEWTYSAKNIQLFHEWTEQGKPDLPTSKLPPQVVEKYGLDSDTVGPEVFYSNEVQNMMMQLIQSGEWKPEPVRPTEDEKFTLTEGESDSEVEWTYSAKNIQLINDWKEQGYPGIPTSGLPPQVVEKYGLDSDTVGPEVFYSNEVQNMMTQLVQSGDWNPETIQIQLTEQEFVTSDSLGISRGPDGLVEMQNLYAEHLGLESSEELPEDTLLLIENFHKEILEADETVMRFEFEEIESYLLGLEHSARIVEEPPESYPNLSDDVEILPMDPLEVIAQLSGYRYNRDEGYAEYGRGKAPTYLFQSKVEKLTMDNEFNSRLRGMNPLKPIPLDSAAGIAITARLGPVDAAILQADSNNYVDKQSNSISRFYSDTNFGGSLLIVEKEVESQGVFEANLTVAGNDALVVPFLYSDDS